MLWEAFARGVPRLRLDREPDIIVSGLGEPAILALRKATTTIPIVMLVAADPVGTGLIANLARPGGNVTGMSILAPELGGKRLAILKEAVATATRVAVLWDAAYPGKVAEFRDSEATATALKVKLQSVEVRGRVTSIAPSRASDDSIPMRW